MTILEPPRAEAGSKLPEWLRLELITKGRVHADGIGRAARGRCCGRCGVFVIMGLDGPLLARPAVVDPWEVDQVTEAVAILSGRGSWWLKIVGNVWRLEPRWPEAIAATRGVPVLVGHRCGSPLSATGAPVLGPRAAAPALGPDPPF